MALNTVASFVSDSTATELGSLVTAGLVAKGHQCSPTTELGGSTTFSVTISGLSLLVIIRPGDADRPGWMLTIGSGVMPTGRLVGMSDDNQRRTISDAIDNALAESMVASDVQWFTADAWAAIAPSASPPERRRWWSRGFDQKS